MFSIRATGATVSGTRDYPVWSKEKSPLPVLAECQAGARVWISSLAVLSERGASIRYHTGTTVSGEKGRWFTAEENKGRHLFLAKC